MPLLAAPMAGGPSTPELVVAAAGADGAGLLAGGYRTPAQLTDQLATVGAETDRFGVNLFVPNPLPVDRAAYRRYRDVLQAAADRFGAVLPLDPVEDDDAFRDKVDVLLAHPPPLVSFTFGLPDAGTRTVLRRAGCRLVQTVTSADEARRAADAGVDALVVQAAAAGGHSATTTPTVPVPDVPLPELLAEVAAAVTLPLIGAGGVADADGVLAVLRAGADAVMVGTALLLAPEAGTSPVHRAALRDPRRGDTVVTHAFTGRPARALRNAYLDEFDPRAPFGYPALHHLTSPLRRAAAAAGDPEYVHLWAGTGYRAARARPLADTFVELGARL